GGNTICIRDSSSDVCSLDLTTSAITTYYYVSVSSDCGTVKSNAVAIIINPSTQIGTQPVGNTYCAGATPSALTVGATGTGTVHYQWYNNGTTNSNTGGTPVGTDVSSYTPSTVNNTTSAITTYYYVSV